MNSEPTGKGIFAIFLTVTTGILSILYADPIFATLPLLLLTLIALDCAYPVKSVKVLEKPPRSVHVRAGDKADIALRVEAYRQVFLSPGAEWIEVEPQYLGPGRHKLTVRVKPQLAAEYRLPPVEATTVTPLGFFVKRSLVEVDATVTAIPRLAVAIARAIAYIRAGAGRLQGETPTPKEGTGLEYLGSRRYVPGDSLRRIDWKATARTLELYVKTFCEETRGLTAIVYDPRVPGPISADKLASSLVMAALNSARSGERPCIYVLGDAKVTKMSFTTPRQAVLAAIGIALKAVPVKPEDIDRLVPPIPLKAIKSMLLAAKTEAEKAYLKAQLASVSQSRIPIAPRPGQSITYISALTGDPQQVIDLNARTRELGGTLTLVTPAEPWRDAKNPSERERLRSRYAKLYKYLKMYKIRIVEVP